MTAYADIILYNGQIRTQEDDCPVARAAAIAGNKIIGVGEDKDIFLMRSEKTCIIDLEDRLVLPGFFDTHFHFYEWVQNYESIDLAGINSFKELLLSIQKKAQGSKKGEWIVGIGFNESDWPDGRIPDRDDLDTVCPDHPVCLWRCDMHLAVANSRALSLAGISRDSEDNEGAVIVKDGAGIPTGILKELGPNLIKNVIPLPSEKTILDNMEKATKDIHRLGLTSIHDTRLMGGIDGADALAAWQRLHQEDRLLLRCHVGLPGEMTSQAIDLGLMTGFGDEILKIGCLKFFADGGMGARTAWMTEKYMDAEYGMPLTPVNEIEQMVKEADQTGLSCMVHAIGDRANKEVIQMFERVEKKGRSRCRIPHRVEHVQMIRPEDLDHLAKLKNVAVSCQPNNLSLDISMVEESVGGLSKHVYALNSILGTGIPMMLSSDAPVSDPNPLAGIYSAVTRRRMDKTPEKGWHMEQAIRVDEAVKGYTITPARATGTGHILGSIVPGKMADMVILDRDIYSIDPLDIAETKVDITIFNGRIVYQ